MLLVAGLLFGFHASGDVLKAFLPIIPMLVGLYGFGFAFASLVLVFSLGPRDLFDEAREYLDAEERGEWDRAKAVAKYVDGVLMLTLPKFVGAHAEALKIADTLRGLISGSESARASAASA